MGVNRQPMIEEIRNCLRTLNPAKVILFGSHANGTASIDSDIDLIVVLDKDTTSSCFREKMQDTVAVKKLLADINRRVALDVLVFSKPEWQALLSSQSSFSREILAKGITLQ
ncbi:MAG: nucleotidyltransferase domain-containing protein [Desulfuromonadales bacterium]|nr:nucleotidyltransferase domain-containing protein [Desulfuromonadales bacterium]MDT8423063.1 nucleotidyltransferase domain-containing protein [Desulfuromonadales bacterium]